MLPMNSARDLPIMLIYQNNACGGRAFSHVSPKLWNLQPMQVRDEHDSQVQEKHKNFLDV